MAVPLSLAQWMWSWRSRWISTPGRSHPPLWDLKVAGAASLCVGAAGRGAEPVRGGNVTRVHGGDDDKCFGRGFVPRALSLRGVLCPEHSQGGAAPAMHLVVSGITVIPAQGCWVPSPCPGMALLPSRGAETCPHLDDTGAMGRGHFPSLKGPVADVPRWQLCRHQSH